MTTEPKHTDPMREALGALVRLHGEQVFINGEDDNQTVHDVLVQAERALSAPSLLADNERLREALRDIVNAANDAEQNEYHVKIARAALSATETKSTTP